MSVVIGLRDKEKCWMACDSQITTGNTKTFLADHHKIFDVPDRPGVIMGHVGYLRGVNLLETNNNYIDELAYYRKELNYDYVVNYVPLAINQLFVENGMVDKDEPTMNLKGDFLLGVGNSLYEIGFDGSVIEVEWAHAIGSGEEFAIGSLNAVRNRDNLKDKEIIKILKEAVLAASENCVGCGGHGIIMNNRDNEIYKF